MAPLGKFWKSLRGSDALDRARTVAEGVRVLVAAEVTKLGRLGADLRKVHEHLERGDAARGRGDVAGAEEARAEYEQALAACCAAWYAAFTADPARTRSAALDDALQTAERIEQPEERAAAQAEIAVVLAAGGDRAAGEAAFLECMAIERGPLLPLVRALRSVARESAPEWKRATFERLIERAQGLDDPGLATEALAEIAVAQAACGLVEEALATVEAIEEDWTRGDALCGVLDVLAERGELEATRDAAQHAEGEGGEELADRARKATAEAAARAGELEEARELLEAIEIPEVRDAALRDVAEALAERGDFAGAKAIALEIAGESERADVLSQLAARLAKAGELEAAEAAAGEIQDPWWRDNARREIATARALAGDLEAASTMAESIEEGWWRAHALLDVGRAHLERGARQVGLAALARAGESVLKSSSGVNPASIQYIVAEVHLRAGDIPRLRIVLEDLFPQFGRPRGLRWVTRERVRARDPGALEDLVRNDEPVERVAMLLGVAEGLSEKRD
jgi:hypothetical protein